MSDTKKLFEMASLAEAAYATFSDSSGALAITTVTDLINRLQDFNADALKDNKSFSQTQAEEFASHYRVISQQANTASGFSATLFERLDELGDGTGEYVFAQRGTEPLVESTTAEPLGRDIAVDLGDLVEDGLAWSQIVDMYNYWKQLTTPVGQTYQRASLVVAPIAAAEGTFIRDLGFGGVPRSWQIQISDAISPAGPKFPVGSSLEVTGHSLGGHLASAFTRLFDGVASQAYTMNGAGYAEVLGNSNIQYVFSQLGGASSFTSTAIQNFRGSAGPDIVTQNWGLVQAGASDQLFIEQGGLFTDNPILSGQAVFGHSTAQITNSAAVYNLFIQLDNDATTSSLSAYMPKLLGIFESGTNNKAASLEEVVRALARTFDVDDSPIFIDDREALYARIKLIQDDPDVQSISGQLLIRGPEFDVREAARTDFGPLVSLIDLSPFSMMCKDAEGSDALAAVWSSTRPEDYAGWLADKSADVPSSFTDLRISDRAEMLALIVERNSADANGIKPGSVNVRYFDSSSNLELLIGADSAHRVQYLFGSDAGNSLVGLGFADRVYGGGGADSIEGLGGNDYLEGNVGNDNLDGGEGSDILWGGAGTDTYIFHTGDGQDTIMDSDGVGFVRIGSDSLSGGNEAILGAQIWQSTDKRYRYLLQLEGDGSQSLVILTSTASDQITVRNFTNGQLGISLDGLPAPTPREFSTIIVGDRAAIDTNPNESGIQAVVGGTPLTRPRVFPSRVRIRSHRMVWVSVHARSLS